MWSGRWGVGWTTVTILAEMDYWSWESRRKHKLTHWVSKSTNNNNVHHSLHYLGGVGQKSLILIVIFAEVCHGKSAPPHKPAKMLWNILHIALSGTFRMLGTFPRQFRSPTDLSFFHCLKEIQYWLKYPFHNFFEPVAALWPSGKDHRRATWMCYSRHPPL